MKTISSLGLASALAAVAFNAPDAESNAAGGAPAETPAEAPAAVKPEKKERIRKNGQTRPEIGSKTGLIWDLGDAIVRDENRVPTRDEVWKRYEQALKDKGEVAAETTLSTQYGRWVIFHGYQAHVKANRAAAKAAKEAQDVEAKAAAEKAKADDKAKKLAEKEAEKAKKKAERDAAKAAKNKPAETPAPEPAPEDGSIDAAANGNGDAAAE